MLGMVPLVWPAIMSFLTEVASRIVLELLAYRLRVSVLCIFHDQIADELYDIVIAQLCGLLHHPLV